MDKFIIFDIIARKSALNRCHLNGDYKIACAHVCAEVEKHGVVFAYQLFFFFSCSFLSPFFLFCGNCGDHLLKVAASQHGIFWHPRVSNFLNGRHTKERYPIMKNCTDCHMKNK